MFYGKEECSRSATWPERRTSYREETNTRTTPESRPQSSQGKVGEGKTEDVIEETHLAACVENIIKLTRLELLYRRLRKLGKVSKDPFFEDVTSSPMQFGMR
jgi:hypothetical protein